MTEDDIFKKLVVANRFMAKNECKVLQNSLDNLRLGGSHKSMLELALENKKITPEQGKRLKTAIKYNLLRQKDKEAVKMMIEDRLLTETQYKRFADIQSETYKVEKKIVSLLDLMSKKKLISKEDVKKYKNKAKDSEKKASSLLLAIPDELIKKGPPEILQTGGLTVKYKAESMDFKGSPVYMSVISAKGSIDSHTAPLFDKMCREVFNLAGDRGRFVLMDLTNVTYMSSAGIGSVIGWKKEAEERGGDVTFVGMKKDIVQVFDLLGVKENLKIFKTSNDAFWSFIKKYV